MNDIPHLAEVIAIKGNGYYSPCDTYYFRGDLGVVSVNLKAGCLLKLTGQVAIKPDNGSTSLNSETCMYCPYGQNGIHIDKSSPPPENFLCHAHNPNLSEPNR